MKSLFKESRNLDFSELLALNGGYGSTSKSSSSSSGYGGSSGGALGKYGKYKTLEEYKKSVEFAKLNEERFYINKDGSGYSSLSGKVSSSKSSISSGTEGSEKEAGSSGQAVTEEVKKEPVIMCITNPHTAEESVQLAMAGNNTPIGLYYKKMVGSDALMTEKIVEQINVDMLDEKIKYEKVRDGFMCDNYAQSLLEKCGVDYSSYFAGEANDKTVAEHIANLDESKNYDSSTVKKGCSYVCFMGSSSKGYEEHCAIMVSTKNGGYYMIDNSSGNKSRYSTGGLGITYANSLKTLEGEFGYSKFYYQKIK